MPRSIVNIFGRVY